MLYASIDIETCGLDPERHKIIEIAAVVDDTANPKPLDTLPRFQALVRNYSGGHDDYLVSQYCLKMHADIWAELNTPFDQIEKLGLNIITEYAVMDKLRDFFLANGFKVEPGKNTVTVTVAGKNFASFDGRFLAKLNHSLPDKGKLKFHHRVIDPAAYFMRRDDEVVPDTNECLRRAGIKAESDHRALADAMNVVRLVRYGLSKEGQ